MTGHNTASTTRRILFLIKALNQPLSPRDIRDTLNVEGGYKPVKLGTIQVALSHMVREKDCGVIRICRGKYADARWQSTLEKEKK